MRALIMAPAVAAILFLLTSALTVSSIAAVDTVEPVGSALRLKAVSKEDVDKADNVSEAEMDAIRSKVDAMNDEQLSTVLDAVLPHPNRRYRRTLGTVRRCIEKVRCLFSGMKRQREAKAAAEAAEAKESKSRKKRESSPAAILRAISKLTGLASSAANELGNRLGLGGATDFSLASLFRDATSSAASSSSSAAADDPDSDLVETGDDSNVAESSDVVQESVCDQRCQLSVLVYRRLRRLLRRL